MLCRMGAWLGLPAAQGFMCGWCTVTRVPGDLPAGLLHGHPSMRGGPWPGCLTRTRSTCLIKPILAELSDGEEVRQAA